ASDAESEMSRMPARNASPTKLAGRKFAFSADTSRPFCESGRSSAYRVCHMPLADTYSNFFLAVRRFGIYVLVTFSAGCAGYSPTVPSKADRSATEADHEVHALPVVRYGRYTLVELGPDAAQRDLLAQIIDISLPWTAGITVGDALNILLHRTGYRLCDADIAAHPLYSLPLPAVHHELGPLTLRDALRPIAGPAWTLDVDSAERRVCFGLKDNIPPAAKSLSSAPRSTASKDNPDRPSRRRRR